MQRRIYTFSFWASLFGVLLGISALFLVYVAKGPDSELHISRVILSRLDPDRLDRNISSVSRWPQWFASLGQAKLLNSETLKPGARVELNIVPKRAMAKPYQVEVEVLEYKPGSNLRLRILKDSSNRLTDLFENLEWNIALHPDPKGSRIEGSSLARTNSWKSRVFGLIAQKILMHQAFLPDLVKLADLRQPFSIHSVQFTKPPF